MADVWLGLLILIRSMRYYCIIIAVRQIKYAPKEDLDQEIPKSIFSLLTLTIYLELRFLEIPNR